MAGSETWSDKPPFNTSGGQCPGPLILQGPQVGGGVGLLALHRFVCLTICMTAPFNSIFSNPFYLERKLNLANK